MDEGSGLGYDGPRSSAGEEEGGGGEVVESKGVSLPYNVFFQILNARHVVLTVGSDMVILSPVQIEALRDMHRCLPQPPDSPPPPAAVPATDSVKRPSKGRTPAEGRSMKY